MRSARSRFLPACSSWTSNHGSPTSPSRPRSGSFRPDSARMPWRGYGAADDHPGTRGAPHQTIVEEGGLPMTFEKMGLSQRIKRCREFSVPYRITDGSKFKLKDIDPADTGNLEAEDKPQAKEVLVLGVETLAELQARLYAQDQWAVLALFQAMDAAGKDGTIKHVMSGVNPQGCQVFSFKQPSSAEVAHDFMWRYVIDLPERGRIGIFNRSYYEEVLVVRVHPELLERQKLPPPLVSKRIWDERLADIAHFEDYATRQ